MTELADKGEKIYTLHIAPQLELKKLKGKIIAIEIESQDYFIENTVLKAIMLGRKKYPQRRFYCKRIGYSAVYSHKGYVPVKRREGT